jgi:predicted phosphodiesterase
MKIQYISDIHSEFYKKSYEIKIPKLADILVLLGDIGKPRTEQYRRLIDAVSDIFDHVIVISGNHEYYHGRESFEKTRSYMHHFFEKYENVYFLDNESITIDGVLFIGSTLWTNIPKEKDFLFEEQMNDYKSISTKQINAPRMYKIRPEFTRTLHSIAYKYIEHQLKNNSAPTIILTHHIPINTKDFIPCAYKNNQLNAGYFSDCRKLIKSPVVAWMFGHCHTPITYDFDGIKLLSNPYGYPGENKTFEYRVFEFDS